MRSPDDVDPQIVFQNVRVFDLRAFGHCIAHVRIALMAVQPAQFQKLAVEEKTVFRKFGFSESEPDGLLVYCFPVFYQSDFDVIQMRIAYVP